MKSIALEVCPVEFPAYTGLQVYMKKVAVKLIDTIVPEGYGKLLKDLVIKAGLDPEMELFITIDEREVEAGTSHRRGGAHIDGNYLFDWGGGGGGWLNGVPGRVLTPDQHRQQYQSDKGGMIIASNYPGCDVWEGELTGIAGQGGDCEHLRDQLEQLNKFRMKPNTAYAANSTCVHQSMPLDKTVKRQLVRLTLDHNFTLQ